MEVFKNKTSQNINNNEMENYYNKIKEIQEKESKSDRFVNILIFLQRYESRKSHLKEEALLKLVGNLDESDFFNMDNKKKKRYAIKKLKNIKNFFKTLYEEDIETNIYLKITYDILELSREECKNIIEDIMNDYNSLNSSEDVQKIRLNVPIPDENLEIFKEQLPTTIQIPYYRPELHKTENISILDEKNIEYYNSYNEIVKMLHEIVIDIYTCRLWKYIPDDYIENIGLNYFNMIINESEKKYVVSFCAKKEKVKKKKKHK